MNKRLLSILMILVLLFGFSACRAKLPDESAASIYKEPEKVDTEPSDSTSQNLAPSPDALQKPTDDSSDQSKDSIPTDSEPTIDSQNPETPKSESAPTTDKPLTENDIHVYMQFYSMEEFIENLKSPDDFLSKYVGDLPAYLMTDISHFYAPALEGYEAAYITMYADHIDFIFYPKGNRGPDAFPISAEYHFYTTPGEGLDLTTYAKKQQLDNESDGIYYREGYFCSAAFSLGDEFMCMDFSPDITTFEQLKPLCVATKYTITRDEAPSVTE